MWRLKSLRLQADEGQDIGRSHGRKERLEGEDKEEHNHQQSTGSQSYSISSVLGQKRGKRGVNH